MSWLGARHEVGGLPGGGSERLRGEPGPLQLMPVAAPSLPEPTPQKLPRWRGFNLLGMFNQAFSPGSFEERDFASIASLGFNFVRLPLDYRFWTDPNDWTRIRDNVLGQLDWAVMLGQRYGL